jgi:hypothetical protein
VSASPATAGRRRHRMRMPGVTVDQDQTVDEGGRHLREGAAPDDRKDPQADWAVGSLTDIARVLHWDAS